MNKYKQFSQIKNKYIERSCSNKKRFNSASSAHQKGMDIYKCKICGGWHRTSKPKGEPIAFKKGKQYQ